MLMIGVTPLPALMKSSLSGSGSGRTNVALDPAEPDERAGPRLAHQERGDLALVDELRRDRRCSRRGGSGRR